MKNRIFVLGIIFLLSFTSITFSDTYQPIYKSIIVNGKANINIDGDFADWANIKVPETKIKTTRDILYSPNNISATFMAFADINNLYIAIKVIDDKKIFNESSKDFGSGQDDDMVVVFFDGRPDQKKKTFDKNVSYIGVTKGRDEKTVMETNYQNLGVIPFIEKIKGVQAVLTEIDEEYLVEILVPSEFIGYDYFSRNSVIGFNIVISDDDDGKHQDRYISWSNDSQNLSWTNPSIYGKIVLSTAFFSETINEISADLRPAVVHKGKNDELIITLKDVQQEVSIKPIPPPQAAIGMQWLDILSAAQNKQYNVVINKLATIEDVSPYLDSWVQRTTTQLAREFVFDKRQSLTPREIAQLSIEIFKENDVTEGLRWTGVRFTRQADYPQAIEYHREILNWNPKSVPRFLAYYDIGFNHKMLGNSEKAIEAFTKCLEHKNGVHQNFGKIPVAYYERGLAYAMIEKRKKAIKDWESIVENYNVHDELYLANPSKKRKRDNWFIEAARHRLIRAYLEERRFEEAKNLVEKMISENLNIKRRRYLQSQLADIERDQQWESFIGQYRIGN